MLYCIVLCCVGQKEIMLVIKSNIEGLVHPEFIYHHLPIYMFEECIMFIS